MKMPQQSLTACCLLIEMLLAMCAQQHQSSMLLLCCLQQLTAFDKRNAAASCYLAELPHEGEKRSHEEADAHLAFSYHIPHLHAGLHNHDIEIAAHADISCGGIQVAL